MFDHERHERKRGEELLVSRYWLLGKTFSLCPRCPLAKRVVEDQWAVVVVQASLPASFGVGSAKRLGANLQATGGGSYSLLVV